jgi:hypothetical protein
MGLGGESIHPGDLVVRPKEKSRRQETIEKITQSKDGRDKNRGRRRCGRIHFI